VLLARLLTAAALLAAAVPAVAGAATPIPPREADAYLQPFSLSGFDDPQPFPAGPVSLTADTSTYTVQDDLYGPDKSGGPREPTRCNGVEYGNTLWVVFHADRWGRMRVAATGALDPVIGFLPFDSPGTPAPDIAHFRCFNAQAASDEEALTPVRPGRWYAVQLGGAGEVRGGQLAASLELLPPPAVAGRPALSDARRPLRVRRLVVKHARAGETLRLRCTRGACGRQTVKVAAGLGTPIRMLRNKRVKPGARIELRITKRGRIGRFYRWTAGRKALGDPVTRCLNPGSKRPRKHCRG
jgi:hypothetical protein